MRINQAQRDRYERDGVLVPPGLFSPDEVAATKQDFGRIQQVDTDHLVREKTGRVARTSFRMAPARQPMAAEWAFPEILAGR